MNRLGASLLLTAALLAALPPAARPAPAAKACREVPGFGCFYAPPSLSGSAPLLVYLRGWWGPYKGAVPASRLLASSRQAFVAYGLGTLADKKGVAVLVTGSSSVSVAPADVSQLSADSGLKFEKTILAAHSGGYVGLAATLTAGVKADRLLMLDDWYEDTGALAGQLQQAISSGATCAGYHTKHNKKNWETVYKPSVQCSIDDMGADTEHDRGVQRCLGAYLTRATCF